MGSKQQKEEKLLTIILPPQPISGLHTLANGISKDNLMVYPGLCRLPQITNAFSKYFDAHSKYERGRAQCAIERLISRRARDADQQRNKNQRQEKKNDFEERPEEKKALEELIQMLQVFLVEANKDKQPYLEEHDIDKLWTLAGSCDGAMEDGYSTRCYEVMGSFHEDLVEAIRVKSRVYRELAGVMEGLSGKLEEVR
ncbi:uncharacterized protein PAC_11268 [Phialocephala subalpina]|uniref:Uncharacterized protein n=1 Tax=Phialocephala subalpina TaxID=576137 RepID=A0A1L7X8N6_9HELO|nr:uncharacterized protein PAC_11268 [Phialocephala subalpina]